MNLSIIIPAFAEEKKIARDILAAAEFLRENNLAGEIIVVDDGSRDVTTAAIAGSLEMTPGTKLKVIRYEQNRGKGFARAFAAWLSKRTGQTYRLLTEAEWEYAARAGSTSRYHFGDKSSDLCRFANVADQSAKKVYPTFTTADCDDGYVHTAPVKTSIVGPVFLFIANYTIFEC